MNIKKLNKTVCLLGAFIALFFALLANVFPSKADNHTILTIQIPSDQESTIAPGRDFYVTGKIEGAQLPEDAKLSVELYKEGTPDAVRTVYTERKDFKDGLYIDYPKLDYYGGDDRSPLKDSLMPDLVYDGVNLETFKDAWRKCYYNDFNFTALISGGTYHTDINLTDEDGTPYQVLEAGNYKVVVKAADHQGTLIAQTEKDIVIGTAADKVLMRFTPVEHSSKVIEQAEAHGYRVYMDPIAGYWDPSDFLESMADSDLFCEIQLRWKKADAQEYAGGKVHFYILNVSPGSAAYSAEIGAVQYTQSVDNPDRLVCYYHDIGEAVLPNGAIESQFVEFEHDDRLALTRADYQTGESNDNELIVSALEYTESDLDFSDGVEVTAGETISVYGVVKPIQNKPEDIVLKDDNSYLMKNKIAVIEYQITGDGVSIQAEKTVGLDRIDGDSVNESLLEFKHDFTFDQELQGKTLEVSLRGYDEYGTLISGTEEIFEIYVN